MLRSEDKREFLQSLGPADDFLLVDGYNILFAWDELKELARTSLDAARHVLMNLLCNYQGYRGCTLILVFDAYKVPQGLGSVEKYHNIHIVYTRQAETADQYIERLSFGAFRGRRQASAWATSDNLEQLIILGHGAGAVSPPSTSTMRSTPRRPRSSASWRRTIRRTRNKLRPAGCDLRARFVIRPSGMTPKLDLGDGGEAVQIACADGVPAIEVSEHRNGCSVRDLCQNLRVRLRKGAQRHIPVFACGLGIKFAARRQERNAEILRHAEGQRPRNRVQIARQPVRVLCVVVVSQLGQNRRSPCAAQLADDRGTSAPAPGREADRWA